MIDGTVGTGAHNATQEITERAAQYADPAMNCDVYFVHKNKDTGKYCTVGVWIEANFGKCNSVYLSDSQVKAGTGIRTESKTKKNPYSGADKASITGTVKY